MSDEYSLPDPKTEEKKDSKAPEEKLLSVRVSAPYKTYFDDKAYSISAENETGPFDILPEHHNFITLLDACEIIIRTPQTDQKIKISQGMMHVKNNQVAVFLDV